MRLLPKPEDFLKMRIRLYILMLGYLAENSIRPFVLGRKNWLFADTPKGASASAAVYSIVETAKANGLNVYTYLNYLLLYMPNTDYRNDPETLEELMPWSPRVQTECKN
ncbi:hypothetical protein DCMF_11360 [Candidatus Formimonas warabiya]|uniref:Uncharacterized protein n=1 Tax=Formimonas warabiya TaxID=1761012 RepID=A0A3G1KS59_FORW1|nr:hypothetical protein DCMF_11360 [Candidatus Formimonas warabiya]